MKKLLPFFLTLWATFAQANVPCTLPFNLQNATTADATQAMANYDAIITCLTNAAAAGVNSDITSLLGLSTPLSSASGGTSSFIGGTSTGSSTAQAVTVTPSSFSLTAGYKVSLTVGFSNSGALTLNVNSSGNLAVFRHTQLGASAFVGGEWVAGQRVMVEYDGTQWQWVGVPPVNVGMVFDHAGGSCPGGTINANNQTVSRTTFAALFTVIGSTWGNGDGVTTFNVPDLRNRATFGQDQNVGGFSNRITVAGNNFDGTVVGNVGGLQNHTMTLGDLVAHNHTITDPGHVHSYTTTLAAGGSTSSYSTNGTLSTPNTGSSVTGITINNAGSTTPFTILAPAAIVSKCVQG